MITHHADCVYVSVTCRLSHAFLQLRSAVVLCYGLMFLSQYCNTEFMMSQADGTCIKD